MEEISSSIQQLRILMHTNSANLRRPYPFTLKAASTSSWFVNFVVLGLPASADDKYLWTFELPEETEWTYRLNSMSAEAEGQIETLHIRLTSIKTSALFGQSSIKTNSQTRLKKAESLLKSIIEMMGGSVKSVSFSAHKEATEYLDGYVYCLIQDQNDNNIVFSISTGPYFCLVSMLDSPDITEKEFSDFLSTIHLEEN